MPLAAILIVLALLGGHGARMARATAFVQEPQQESPPSQPQQDAPPAPAAPDSTQPQPDSSKQESKPEPHPEPAPAPEQAPPASPEPQAESSQPTAAGTGQTVAPPAAKPRKKHTTKKKRAASNTSEPTKVVVRNGGTADPQAQLSPKLSKAQAEQEIKNTNQLLATTDTNLKQLAGRRLNSSQQDTLSQVRKYIEQARAATNAGDLQRAHNLAFKAQLLSADLVKP